MLNIAPQDDITVSFDYLKKKKKQKEKEKEKTQVGMSILIQCS
jgi:hypothetical protein